MKKLIGIIALLGIVLSLTYTGCRKGEDDPFLSLRSRDKRIIGTWLLKSSSDVTTTSTTTTDYNNQNSEKTTVAKSITDSKTFDGTVFTEDITNTTTTTQLTTDAVLQTTGKYNYNTTTAVMVENTNDIDKKTYSVELEINEDHTYKATITETNTSSYFLGKLNIGGLDKPDITTDTTYSPANSRTRIEEGDWYWEDANNKKIMIVAGNVMNGKLKRLSNKEVILEDITEESDDNTLNTTVVDYPDSLVNAILTYNDNTNQYRDTTGVKINHLVKTTSRTSTWEAKK